MSSVEQQQVSVDESVKSLYSGVDHQATWERSYNAVGRVYSHLPQLKEDWMAFKEESVAHNRRRAVMRCYVSGDLLPKASNIPIEAVVPIGDEYLVWIGKNQHQNVATLRDVRNLPPFEPVELSPHHHVDSRVQPGDVTKLTELWGQFGWTSEAVKNFVRNHANGNPIALIRNMQEEAIGVMIAESIEFGARRLVEITELAVDPSYRGHHLATILIRELSRLSLEQWSNALVFGEYNLTSRSYISAARAGQLPGQTSVIDGVLRDHVGIETGHGNQTIGPWNTRWLHHFLVMYQPNRRVENNQE